METNFWLERWQENEINFHKSEANPMLVNYFSKLGLDEGSRLFLPLCGKTLDIAWLLSKGYRVAGAELSELAIEQLFAELGVEPNIAKVGDLTHYSAHNIDIFVGNIFELSREALGPVDAIYDRAALVALPEEMRKRYTSHLTELTKNVPQLLICFEYDQSVIDGPPFSVSAERVNQYYGKTYDIRPVATADVAGGLKGMCPAKEHVWLLQNDG